MRSKAITKRGAQCTPIFIPQCGRPVKVFFGGLWASILISLCRYLALERGFQSPLDGKPLSRGL